MLSCEFPATSVLRAVRRSAHGILTRLTVSAEDGNHLPQAATDLLAQIKQLTAPPTNAKNILVLDDYGFGTHSAIGDAWKQAVFAGLTPLRAQGLNVAFVDFAPLWDGVLGTSPGFKAFGYLNPGGCIPDSKQTDLSGECATPLNSFYWLPRWVNHLPIHTCNPYFLSRTIATRQKRRIGSWLIMSTSYWRTARRDPVLDIHDQPSFSSILPVRIVRVASCGVQ